MNMLMLFMLVAISCQWPLLLVTGWNIQESLRILLETIEDSEHHDIVFPLVLNQGTVKQSARKRRHIYNDESVNEDIKDREKKTNSSFSVNGALVIKHELCDNGECNEKRISDRNASVEYLDELKSSGYSDNCRGYVRNSSIVQRKDDLLENGVDKTINTNNVIEENKGESDDFTVISLNDWIIEVTDNKNILVEDDLQAEWVSTEESEPVDTTDGCLLQTGTVRGFPNSIVALTTCDTSPIDHNKTGDMTGLIQIDGESYFVQPLVPTGGLNRQHPHLVYKVKKNLKLGDDEDFGNEFVASNRSMDNDSCNVNNTGGINHDLSRTKRESYWRHRVAVPGAGRNNASVVNSTQRNRLHIQEPPQNLEHIRRKLQREEEVGYFLDVTMESEVPERKRPLEYNVNAPPRWLELALAVDHTVIRFHGRERVQQYVLALMNIVSAIYKDPSLDSNLRLVIVRMIFFEDEHLSQVVEGNSKRSLENVNRWNENLGGQHDVAVWLTRADIGGPSGYAPVSGACDPTRSCTLNRDEGLTSAFIIAHELAHVLGLTHDGDLAAGNDCIQEAVTGSVMAPMVSATFHRFSWSTCSKREFHTKAAQWPCLRNQPKIGNATHLNSTLQATFSMDEQCRMEFGDGYSLCRTLNLPDPCSHLWCGHYTAPLVCKTKKGPPLEGTECGVNHWCVGGFCVLVDRRRFRFEPVTHNPRDGGWSEWSSWTSCSRTCGFGVSFRSRLCDNPRPVYGGRECIGKSEEFLICGQTACPEPLKDVRAQQCARLPTIVPLGGLGHRVNNTWLAHEADPNSMKCQLTCVSRETGEVFMSGENLIDGTPCSYDNYDKSICIQGHCQALGCDGVLESSVQQDSCGVCGGDNSQCRNITNTFERKLRRAMTRVAVFPRLARDVWIDVRTRTAHADLVKLVIRDRRSRQYSLASPDDLRLKLSGPVPMYGTVTVWTVPATKERHTSTTVVVEGARFHYERRGDRERLWARGPLLAELVVSMSAEGASLDQGVEVASRSGYTLHQTVMGAGSRYVWQVGGWGPCSRSCGGGRRHKTVACRDTDTGRLVPRRHCSLVAKPTARMERCNLISCDFVWVSGDWEECTTTCGSRGLQEREIFCVHNRTNSSDPPWRHMVNPEQCRVGIKPDTTRPCNRLPCPAHWIGGNWSQCSVSCGHGVETREFRCPAPRGEPFFDCGPSPSDEHRPCKGEFRRKDPLCYKPKPCRRDMSTYCRLTVLLGRYCVIPGFKKLCCKSCSLILNMLPE
ncbi:A disintegrin and metalloproteinase with thrombospondin motifs 1-like [Periplaneta americana]|uniref:A disintegrin and metalloproteinase with thrombospondin motifs 1-like n=1 Tax=Periplaneta americana TaxID=6978 RepID=UPI0037E97B02